MTPTGTSGRVTALFGAIGRFVGDLAKTAAATVGQVGGIAELLFQGLFHAALAPFAGPRKILRQQLLPLMRNVGARSFPIGRLPATPAVSRFRSRPMACSR